MQQYSIDRNDVNLREDASPIDGPSRFGETTRPLPRNERTLGNDSVLLRGGNNGPQGSETADHFYVDSDYTLSGNHNVPNWREQDRRERLQRQTRESFAPLDSTRMSSGYQKTCRRPVRGSCHHEGHARHQYQYHRGPRYPRPPMRPSPRDIYQPPITGPMRGGPGTHRHVTMQESPSQPL